MISSTSSFQQEKKRKKEQREKIVLVVTPQIYAREKLGKRKSGAGILLNKCYNISDNRIGNSQTLVTGTFLTEVNGYQRYVNVIVFLIFTGHDHIQVAPVLRHLQLGNIPS